MWCAKVYPKVSQNDIEMSHVDMKKAHPVDFWSHLVVKRSVLTAIARRILLDVTRNSSGSYGENPQNKSNICDRKVAF